MLKGHVFSRQLFGNPIFALFINTFLNGKNGISDNYKNGMELSHSGTNITIQSGAVCIQGRFIEEDTYSTISAENDIAFCKLVIEIDLDQQNTESELNQVSYKIIKSASSYPNLTQTNIVKNNAGVYQYELARFKTTGNDITDFQDKRTFIDFESIYDEIQQHIEDIDNGSLYVQKSGGTMTGKLYANAGIEGNVTGNISGNAATTTKLATARTIGLSGGATGTATSFNGTANITIPVTSIDATKLSGTASIATTGNAGTATKLKNARKINGTNFDGSGDITTSKWGSSRNFALTGAVSGSANVDGSGNISIATTQANIKILTGTISCTFDNNEGLYKGTKSISYPTGYNKENCIAISLGLAYDEDVWICEDSKGYNKASVRLFENNISLSIGGGPSPELDYKIILMKIS